MECIKRIYNKNDGKDIDITSIDIKKTVATSSNTKLPVYRFFNNGEMIKKHNELMVIYSCKTCGRDNVVCLNNITRKLNKGINSCKTCENQAIYMKANESYRKTINDVETFKAMDEEFKQQYFRKHMTSEEFNRIRDKIISFQNDKFKWSDNFEYYEAVSIPNQSRFTSYFYDKSRDILEKPIYIKYLCEGCNEEFTNRDLYVQKNKYKILCQGCTFCNNTFKIKNYKNVNGDQICYQSQYELKFIKFCNSNKIVITNGPKVVYKIGDKTLNYKIDFQIRALNMLIELKDNHHYNKKKGMTGKFKLKEDAALKYANQNNEKYVIIFPFKYVEFCKAILEQFSNKI